MTLRGYALAAAAALALATGGARAQDYPSRSITIVVPYAAGGPTDTVARVTADAMGRQLGQQIVVENITGAGGTLGSRRVAQAEPDGYTLLVHHVGMATSATLYRNLSYDPRTAFQPVGLITDAPMTIISRANLEPGTLQDLVTYIKANKDRLTYANAGIGAASHLCGLLFQTSIDTQMTTVPYKGNGPIMTDLLGGQIDLTCDQATNTVSQIKAGKVKAFASTTKERMKELPDLPTADEAGLKGFELSVWHGLYAPKGTPEPVVKKLSQALQAALRDETVQKRFADIATTTVSQERATPKAHQAHLIAEIDRWAPIIKAAGQYAD